MADIHSQRVTFLGSQGRQLAGILDAPQGTPFGYILMAHCFTCSKDLKASVRISRGLASLGWSILRFDFGGLGNSQGDFAQTNFQSNRLDLLAAASFITYTYQSPCLLIGHSFGGATAMSIANELDSLRGVVTLAAPSETKHLAEILLDLDPRIESEGQGIVKIGGRLFPVAKQMLESFRAYDLTKDIAELRKPLLILHSLADETVGYHHAMRIYSLVMHSKRDQDSIPEVSLITLPKSDHLLVNDPRDIPMIVSMISAWGLRLI